MRSLYLHEYVDIVGQGAATYMEHAQAFDADAAAGRGVQLLGTWEVVGSSGRWPQVVNVWELVGGWQGWHALVDHANVRRRANQALADWWEEAYRVRSGGFDRLLGAVPGCPSLAELQARGVRGSLFVHELSHVRPGAALDYLAAVRDEWAPVRAEHGHTLVGLYEVLLGDTEVVTVWAASLDAHVAAGQAEDAAAGLDDDASVAGDERILKWRQRAREWLTGWREELMVPAPGTPLAEVAA